MKTQKLKSYEIKALGEILKEKTGRELKRFLIDQAFTRRSFSARYGGGNNENLEFIGDTILAYHVVKRLCAYYGNTHCDEYEAVFSLRAREKDLTALKSVIVSNRTLASVIDGWDVCQYLVVGQSDIDNEIDKQEKIKADLLEAIIGAYAVQSKWDQEYMESVISTILPLDDFIREYERSQIRPPCFKADNAVTKLKELAEHGECSVPIYDISGPDSLGYNKSGEPLWHCLCIVEDHGASGNVFSHSKKDSKKYAAYLALCEMFELSNEYGPDTDCVFWFFDGKKLIPNPPDELIRG